MWLSTWVSGSGFRIHFMFQGLWGFEGFRVRSADRVVELLGVLLREARHPPRLDLHLHWEFRSEGFDFGLRDPPHPALIVNLVPYFGYRFEGLLLLTPVGVLRGAPPAPP